MSNQLEKIKELIDRQRVRAVAKRLLPSNTKKVNIQPVSV